MCLNEERFKYLLAAVGHLEEENKNFARHRLVAQSSASFASYLMQGRSVVEFSVRLSRPFLRLFVES